MATFNISNTFSGVDLGNYEAVSEFDALNVMARDAGYVSYAEACNVAPVVSGEILVVPVDDATYCDCGAVTNNAETMCGFCIAEYRAERADQMEDF